jgi:hypothetical protein
MRRINRAWQGLQQWRHKERKAAVYAWVLQQLEAGIRTRRQRARRRKSGGLASDLERPLARRRIHGDRIVECKSRLQMIGTQMRVSRNGQRMAHHRMRGMQCPKKAAWAACLDRCRVRRWIHHGASGKDLDRQSLRMDFRWHSYPTLLSWPRGATFAERSRVLPARKVVKGSVCGLSQ